MKKTYILDMIFIILLCVIGYSFYGVPYLFSPDETRYAEIPREMLVNNNFTIPRLDNIIYFEKPPLIYWLTAFFIHIFGDSNWAVRLVNPVLSTLGLMLTYSVCRIVFDNRRVALLAVIFSLTSLLYIISGKYLNLDAGIAFFLNGTMLCFIASHFYLKINYFKSCVWIFFAFIFAGLSVMTKGLIGIVFPMMIIAVWALMMQNWKLFLDYRLYLGLIIVIIISVPWIIMVNNEYPEFAYQFLIVQQILRYATDEQNRQISKFAYLGMFTLSLFPWVTLLPQAIRKLFKTKISDRKNNQIYWFIFIWGAVIFLFFGVSKSFLAGYLIPLIVPFCILIAIYIDSILDNKIINKSVKISLYFSLCFIIILTIALFIIPLIPQFYIYFFSISKFFYPAGIILSFIIYKSVIHIKKNDLKKVLLYFVFAMIILGNLTWAGSSYLAQKSVKPLTVVLQPILKKYPNATIANYNHYFYGSQFYLNRLVWIVGNSGELGTTSKFKNSGADKSLMEKDIFWKLWNDDKQVFAFFDSHDYNKLFASGEKLGYLIDNTQKRYLLTNHKIEKN